MAKKKSYYRRLSSKELAPIRIGGMVRKTPSIDLYRGAAITRPLQLGSAMGGVSAGRIGAATQQSLIDRANWGDKSAAKKLGLGGLGGGLGSATSNKFLGVNLGGFGGFLNRFFGKEGMLGAFTGLPSGLYEAGKAAFHDITNLRNPQDPFSKSSQTRQKIVKPILKDYAYRYGPLTQGKFGEFFKRVGEKPFSYFLDAAMLPGAAEFAGARVGSLGARVAGPGRAGNVFRRMAQWPDVTKRPNLEVTTEVKAGQALKSPSIPRFYGVGANRRIFQKAITDPLLSSSLGRANWLPKLSGGRTSMRGFAERRGTRRMGRTETMQLDVRAAAATGAAVKQIAPAVIEPNRYLNTIDRYMGTHLSRALNKNEAMALSLRKSGITPQVLEDGTSMVDKYQQMVRQSIEGKNPAGANMKDFPEVSENYVKMMAELPEPVRQLIHHPTDRMLKASQAWDEAVADGLKFMPEVDEATHLGRVWGPQYVLTGKSPAQLNAEFEAWAKATGAPERVIRPNYVPHVPATNVDIRRVGLNRVLKRGEEEVVWKGRRAHTAGGITAEEVFRPPSMAYLKEDDMLAFQAGVFRTDPRVLLQHLRQREHDMLALDQMSHRSQFVALKDEFGEPITVKNRHELAQVVDNPEDFALMFRDLPVQWFNKETNVMGEVIRTLQETPELKNLDDVGKQQILDSLNGLMDDNARAFVQEHLGAMKTDAWVVPRSYWNELVNIAKVKDPYNPVGNVWVQGLNRWRALVLAYMPRWWVNTAVGTAMLGLLKGVWDPRYYVQAARMVGKGKLPPGVGLGTGVSGAEISGFGAITKETMARRIASWVQKVEDYFRTSSFLHAIDRQGKQKIRESVGVFENHRSATRGVTEKDYLQWVLADTRRVEAAIDEVNHFHYNFLSLGPFERRYMRQVMPFWGWYKFVTKLVWRLPFEFPGRMQVINKLGEIGMDSQEEMGWMPEWMKGAIFLNKSDPKKIKFISTFGLNPFAQFATPFAAEGSVSGMLRPGMLAPPIQAAMAGAGIDTMTGDRVAIAPDAGVSEDFFGQLWDTRTGEKLESPGARRGGARILGSLARSIPQVRIGEMTGVGGYMGIPRVLPGTGGRPVYPESLPFIAPKPMDVREETMRDISPTGIAAQYTGVFPRTRNLQLDQSLRRKQLAYSKARGRKSEQRYKKFLAKNF